MLLGSISQRNGDVDCEDAPSRGSQGKRGLPDHLDRLRKGGMEPILHFLNKIERLWRLVHEDFPFEPTTITTSLQFTSVVSELKSHPYPARGSRIRQVASRSKGANGPARHWRPPSSTRSIRT